MRKKTVIPKPPEPFVITEEVKEKLKKWISYFKGLSPRIKVILPSDKDFSLDYFLEMAQKCIDIFDENSKIIDWPVIDEIAFIVSFDSSMPNQKARYLAKNTYIFCYYDVAFGLEYFERDDDTEVDNELCYNFSLRQYEKSALSWRYIGSCIKKYVTQIENLAVKTPPKG